MNTEPQHPQRIGHFLERLAEGLKLGDIALLATHKQVYFVLDARKLFLDRRGNRFHHLDIDTAQALLRLLNLYVAGQDLLQPEGPLDLLDAITPRFCIGNVVKEILDELDGL